MKVIKTDKFTLLIILFLISFAIYLPGLKAGFFWDDRALIPELKNQTEIVGTQEEFRPFRAFSFFFDHFLWRENPAGYHFTNLILNSISVIFVFYFTMFLFQNKFLAFISSLFFAFHPVHVETVVWIKNRTEIFSLIFYLWSFLAFFKNYYLSIFLLALALLSKETAATFPVVLTVYLLLFRKKEIKKTIPFWFLSFIRFAFTYRYAPELLGFSGEVLTPVQHLWVILKTYAFYFSLLIFPKNLCVEWRFKIPENLFSELFKLFLIIGIFFLLIYLFRRKKKILFLLLFLFISILPQSNIFYIAGRPWAEQRLFLPSLSFCILLSLLVFQLKKKNLIAFFSAFILFLYGAKTFTRTKEWLEPVSFWKKAIEITPFSPRLHLQLGDTYFDKGMYEKAIKEYKKAISLDKNYYEGWYNLGLVQMKKKNYKEAIKNFQEALKLKKDDFFSFYNTGICYLEEKKYQEALRAFEEAKKIFPENVKVYNNIGVIYKRLGMVEESIKEFKKAIELNPESISARYNLAMIYKEKGNLQEAIAQLRAILKIQPHNQLASLLYEEIISGK